MPVTDIEIKNAKPAEGGGGRKLFDGGGMYLLIKANGSKLWQMAFRNKAGKQQTLSFGAYPEVSLKEARERRDAARRQIRDGVNPNEAKRDERATLAARRSFAQVTEAFLKMLAEEKRSDKTRDRDDRLTKYLVEAFGKKPLEDVEPADLTAVLDRWAGQPETRRRLQALAMRIMGFACGKSMLKRNPFWGVDFNLGYASQVVMRRAAILEPAPFGDLLRDMAAYSGRRGNLVGVALELLAHTFVRPGTVAAAEWCEIDLNAALWTIPASKLKQRTFRENTVLNGKPHHVPLSRQVVAMLRDLKEQTGWSVYLFPGRPSRPISGQAFEAGLNAMGYQGKHTPHGFRSSASTMLNREKVKVDDAREEVSRFTELAIEYQLEHVNLSQAAAYNRDELLPERKRLMQFWSDKIDQMRDGIQPAPEGSKAPHLREVV